MSALCRVLKFKPIFCGFVSHKPQNLPKIPCTRSNELPQLSASCPIQAHSSQPQADSAFCAADRFGRPLRPPTFATNTPPAAHPAPAPTTLASVDAAPHRLYSNHSIFPPVSNHRGSGAVAHGYKKARTPARLVATPLCQESPVAATTA